MAVRTLTTIQNTDGTPTNTVLLVTDNLNRAEDIKTHLFKLNFLVKDCLFDGVTLHNAPKLVPTIILLALTDYIEKAPSIVAGLKKHYGSQDIPVLATLSRRGDMDMSFLDSVIYPPAHPSQVATRVDSLIRLSAMEQEIMRRITTLKEGFNIDYTLEESALSRPFKILFVGKPTPEFMVVINALQEKNVDVVAAFTTFSAFDYLYEAQFNAVVLNALEDVEPPLTISSTMRKNAKLYHIPTLLLVDGATFDQHERAFEKGARDLIEADANLEEISGRILELANYHRIHSQLKREFSLIGGDSCVDKASSTFNAAFFHSHLQRSCEALNPPDKSLSIIAVKVRPNAPYPVAPEEFETACAQVGNMIKNLVRMQDITGRVERDTYLVAFPNETEISIAPVIERISAIVDCAAFSTKVKDAGPFTVELEISASELKEGETSKALAARTLEFRNNNIYQHKRITA